MSPERLRIRVDYDFASTLCYAAHRAMQRLAPELDALGLDLAWSPLDLSRLTGWRRGAEVPSLRRANAARVARELGVAAHVPRCWADSRRAAAIAIGLSAAAAATWRERVWSAVYEQGRALDDRLCDTLAAEQGIAVDEAALARGLAALETRTRAAHAEGVTGVPCFLLGEWPFGGIQTDDTMLSLFSRHARRAREVA